MVGTARTVTRGSFPRDGAPRRVRLMSLCDRAGDDEVGHPVVVVTEDVTQDDVGVLADRRAGPRGVRLGARVGPVGSFDERVAMVGMGDQAEVAPVSELRVVQALHGVLHVVGGDVGGLEAILDDLGRELGCPGADDPVELGLACAPLGRWRGRRDRREPTRSASRRQRSSSWQAMATQRSSPAAG